MGKLNPLDFPIAFAQPSRLPDDPSTPHWVEHVPFAMFLIDALRPRTIVELGTHTGLSYCAFCQAVREIATDTRCYAIDTWRGDDQAGSYGAEVLTDLRAHHDPLYGDFSRLVQTTFDEAVGQFADGSIDLLHIDGCHTYDAVKHNFENWLPKLSGRGVVLLHDINVREHQFGVWKLWEELSARYPHFSFLHGRGLGLLVIDQFPSEALRGLVEYPATELPRLREFFQQLGQCLTKQYEREHTVAALSARVAARESELAAKDHHIRNLSDQAASREQHIANLREQVAAVEQQAHTVAQQLSNQEQYIATITATLAAREQQVQQLTKRSADQERQVTSLTYLSADRERLASELTVVTSDREQLLRQLGAIESRLSWQLLNRLLHAQMRVVPPDSRQGRAWMSLTRLARTGLRPLLARGARAYGARPDTQHFLGGGNVGVLSNPVALYEEWVRRCEALRYDEGHAAYRLTTFDYLPLMSIVMPIYNTDREYLRKAINSVRAQYYPHWELCICDDASPAPHVREILEGYATDDARIKIIFSSQNGGIVAASNRALGAATGEFVGLLDHDDELTPDALLEVVAILQTTSADLLYSDEDKLDLQGRRCDPFFKPAWSPDLALADMYTCHFSVYRKALIEQIGGFRIGFDGSQDYDLMLRFTEIAQTVVHIPKILYHWRKIPASTAATTTVKPYAYEAGRKALVAALERRGIAGEVIGLPQAGYYRVKRSIVAPGKVSIIIPTRDRLELLRQCIKGIEANTSYPDYEIIIVDNGSRNAATRAYLSRTAHRVIHDDGPFNYSRLNNRAARAATGEYLLLLNNDTEPLDADWLTALVEQAQRPEVGAVGAKLLYPDGRIQHAGVIIGLHGVGDHAERFVDGHGGTGYANFPNVVRNYSAVTGACLMIRRALFEELGGLDEEHLAVSFNDLDLCLRLRERGYLVVYTPHALVRHHESVSRGGRVDPVENRHMLKKWRPVVKGDPYYHPCFDLTGPSFALDYEALDALRPARAQVRADGLVPLNGLGHTIEQGFTLTDGALCAVSVKLATYRARCNGELHFRLRDARTAETLASATVNASHIRDNQYCLFTFRPITDAARRRLLFSLEFIAEGGSSRLAISRSAVADPLLGRYRDGDQPGEGTLTFKAYTFSTAYREVPLRPSTL